MSPLYGLLFGFRIIKVMLHLVTWDDEVQETHLKLHCGSIDTDRLLI